ncbi:MAG: zf-HC2 domain-containing protein [Planctomycetes bacterium]|nr:zf-HC2 domain-containing protein [Planctomycetota bacterium]
MTCDECRDMLQDLVDNEVGPAERSALEAHMTTCVECARLHRQLSKFTTTMVKTMAPLKTNVDFAGQVLARFEESKSDLTRMPDEAAEPPAPRTWPVWPFAAIVGLCVLTGLAMLFLKKAPEPAATLSKGRELARIMTFDDRGWSEAQGTGSIYNGNRVEAVEAPGKTVELDFGAEGGAVAVLRSPCKVQIQKSSRQIELAVLQDAPGRIQIRISRGDKKALELKTLLVSYKLAKAMVPLGEAAVVDIEPGAAGELAVSVKKGSAQIFNASEKEDVAEGYARTIPQSGPSTPAIQAKSNTFDWADGK